MFFNQDILFRNGSLALIWIAGNEELKNKKSHRNKDYQAALKTNVATVCKDLRALFPNMGSAYGVSLKKMGFLAKGLGVIYFIKLEQFSRDVYQATISLRRPPPSANNQIEMPKAKSKTTNVNANQADAVNGQTINDGLGERNFEEGIQENFGNLDFEEDGLGTPRALQSRLYNGELRGTSRRVLFTPARSVSEEDQQVEDRQRQRKRRRQEDDEDEETMYREVCRKLRTGLDMTSNVDAHCLREDDNLLLPEDNLNDYDLGDGMAFLNEANLDNDGLPAPAELQAPELTSGIGPHSSIEYEDSDHLRAMETPTGAGTRAQNSRRPRNEGREADETMMELGEIDAVITPRRRIRAVRKRLRLDRKENFTLEEMLLRINAVKDATTMNILERELVKTRAPGKSEWKYVFGKVENFILAAGRPCPSRALNDMVQDIMTKQIKNHEPQQIWRNQSKEAVMAAVARSSVASEPDPEQNRAIRTVGLESGMGELENVAPEAQLNEGPEIQFGMELDGEQGFGSAAQYDAVPDPEERRQRRKSREARNEERSKLSGLDESNIFADLFPPREVTRRKAALAFSMLLKMQAKKEVFLREDEPYGPIRIDRLKG